MTALSAQGYGFPDVHPIVWSVPCVGRLQCTTPRWMHVQYLHGIATNPITLRVPPLRRHELSAPYSPGRQRCYGIQPSLSLLRMRIDVREPGRLAR